MSAKDAILITGPTASGKSALAVKLAQAVGGEVVNADSMQVYDTLRVITARPSVPEMEGVAHHLYGHVPAGHLYSTGAWLRAISAVLDDIRGRGKVPVVVGGTGLYFKALTEGLADMPEIPQDLRDRLRSRLSAEGAGALHAELQALDPEGAERLSPSDGQRVVRALEVLMVSGEPIRVLQARASRPLIEPDRAEKRIVLLERPILHARINRRFEAMFADGAVEEVEALLALGLDPAMPAMKAIGVPQVADMLAGRLTPAEVIEQASAATRQYAKRQMTWFRNQMDESWLRVT